MMEGLLRSWGLSIDSPTTAKRLALPEREGGRLRSGRVGSGDAGATTGDAGAGDPAYRVALWAGWWAPAARGRLARRSSPTLRAVSRRQPYLGGGAWGGRGDASATTGDAGAGGPAYRGRLARRGDFTLWAGCTGVRQAATV